MTTLLCLGMLNLWATTVQYEHEDSVKVVELLKTAPREGNLMVHFARQLIGVPYVGHTLEPFDKERLIVNLRQLDCTTMVENALALSLCVRDSLCSFEAFCHVLQKIRYEQGDEPAYIKRLHYFTSWVDNAEHQGFAREYHDAYKPFSGRKILNINYMTTHPSLYPMMNGNDEMTGKIRSTEQSLTGRRQQYIPKQNLRDTSMRKHIADGDIIVIVTNKKGLDTSHIGLACWQDGSLHLLNASSIHKKVVIEPMTLYAYMQRHPSQIGIRVIRLTDNK